MRAARTLVLLLSLCAIGFVGSVACGEETVAVLHEVVHDDSIRIVPFSQPTWFGERIREAIRLRDVATIGYDRYRYHGTVTVGNVDYHVDFSKKLRWVLLYHQQYYFICQEYFSWYEKFDFYVIPSDQNHGDFKKITLAQVPDEILKYQFPADDIVFICAYQYSILRQLFDDKDYDRMIRLLHNYAGVSPYSGALANSFVFNIVYMKPVLSALKSGTFPTEYKKPFFAELKLFLPTLLKMSSLNSTVADIAECLLYLSPEEGNRIVTQFLEQYSALQQPGLTDDQRRERKSLISDLKRALEQNQEQINAKKHL